MKNTILIAILSIFTLFMSSCTKPDDNTRPDNSIVNIEDDATLFGINWTLSDAKFYTENLDNGEFKYYDHFSTSSMSTLDPISGADIIFDTIVNGVTTWNITNNSFVLNGTVSHTISGNMETAFVVHTTPNPTTISRPVEILELTKGEVVTITAVSAAGDTLAASGTYNTFSIARIK